jgi:hypothetical protein
MERRARPRGAVRSGRVVRDVVLVTGLALGALTTTVAPAGAHGPGGLQPTNYRTRVTGVTPTRSGIRVTVVDLGTKLELTNTSGQDVIVLGYDAEPYLRVGPRGAFENERSPATYLNRTTTNPSAVPATADATAEPRWQRIGDGPTVRWHDHRAHWMGSTDPPEVGRAPGSEHLVQRFQVELTNGGAPIEVRGDVRWIPGPSPWPWVGGAAVLALVVSGASTRRRGGAVLGAGLGTLVVAQIVHVIGLWGGSTASSWSRLATSAYALGGIVLAVAALAVLVRRGPRATAPLALLAGLALTLAGGLADVTTFSRSQVPTTTSLGLDRLAVAVTLGAGVGVVAAAAWRLRRPPRRIVPRPVGTDAPAIPSGIRARYRGAASETDSQS